MTDDADSPKWDTYRDKDRWTTRSFCASCQAPAERRPLMCPNCGYDEFDGFGHKVIRRKLKPLALVLEERGPPTPRPGALTLAPDTAGALSVAPVSIPTPVPTAVGRHTHLHLEVLATLQVVINLVFGLLIWSLL